MTAYNASGFNQYYGYGRVNADTAVDAVPGASGDYNRNGAVDAADYVLWRKTQGNSVATAYAGQNGNGNKTVASEDYTVWRSHFGQTITPPGPGSGSGSSFSESVTASAPPDIQDNANPLTVEQNLMADANSTNDNAPAVRLFSVTLVPIGPSFVPSTLAHRSRSALASLSLGRDEGLLAWLSARSAQPTGNIDNVDIIDESDHHFFADDLEHYGDVADIVFDMLAPSIRTAVKPLVSIG